MAMATLVTGLLGLLGAAHATVIAYTKTIPHTIAEEFRDLPADFGPDFPFEGLRGLLAAGVPESGCSVLAPPPDYENFTGKWIVLISRYNCSFETKIRNAQAAGYDCAIVHNVNSSELETMSANDPEGIDIPSVFVSNIAGELLYEQYLYNSSYYIMVNGDLPFNINLRLMWAFAAVVVLCLIVILIFLIIKCIKDRRRDRRNRLPNSVLKRIPTCKFSKGDPYDTCAICLDDYVEGDTLRVLPCAHAYHSKCVDQWLTKNRRVCPVCKRRVAAHGERRLRSESSDSDDDAAPLIGSNQRDNGTFASPNETRVRRAILLIRNMRSRASVQQQEAPPPPPVEEEQTINSTNEDIVFMGGDTESLLPRRSARRSRSGRRRRRSAPGAAAVPDPGAGAVPAPVAVPNGDGTNDEDSGEIGVAALPITAQSNSLTPPRHV